MDQPVGSLNLPTDLIHKLKNAGFHYCSDVKDNLEVINLKMNFSSWSSTMDSPKPKTALELLQEENKFQFPGSPISKLDSLLKSVLVPGCITELCGLPGSGKTQICLNIAVGMKGDVVFIHTNRNLSPDRLREIFVQEDIEKMFCIKATEFTELLASVEFLETWLSQHKYVHMVLIDSISWPLQQKPPLERGSLVCTLFQKLRILANKHALTIVITNNLTTKIEGEKTYYTSCFTDSFYHFINNRVLLTKKENIHKAEVLKSVSGHHSAVLFEI